MLEEHLDGPGCGQAASRDLSPPHTPTSGPCLIITEHQVTQRKTPHPGLSAQRLRRAAFQSGGGFRLVPVVCGGRSRWLSGWTLGTDPSKVKEVAL